MTAKGHKMKKNWITNASYDPEAKTRKWTGITGESKRIKKTTS